VPYKFNIVINMIDIIICIINIIIFIRIKSINIKNTIICVINIMILIIINIINIIINKFIKNILLILKNNNRFDLKGKIRNYYHYYYYH
jgi:hypothetical protein